MPRPAGTLLLPLALALALSTVAAPASAQVASERVDYENAVDGTPLSATLTLPAGSGPFPAVVVLSLAGVDELVTRMTGLGWAVMVPERRGMRGSPERILRARFRDMADDVAAAGAYLRSRPDVDGGRVGLLAQGGETMAGMLAAAEPPTPAFVVLMSPTSMAGDESFRMQQRLLADGRNLGPEEVEALDRLLEELAGIVRTEDVQAVRAERIHQLLGGAAVRPYQSSSFPADVEGQVRFFSSPWWRDFFTFAPDSVLARFRSPTLVLMGQGDPFVPLERNLPPLRRGLEAAPTDDVTVCVVEGRVQHAFPRGALDALEAWMRARTPAGEGTTLAAQPGTEPPATCLEEDDLP